MEDSLSAKLDKALYLEEYHRQRLLYWKQERHRLESELRLVGDELLVEVGEIVDRAFENQTGDNL